MAFIFSYIIMYMSIFNIVHSFEGEGWSLDKTRKPQGCSVWMNAAVIYRRDVPHHPLLAALYLEMFAPPPTTTTPVLQLCAPWVSLRAVSLGSIPSLIGRGSPSLSQNPPLFLSVAAHEPSMPALAFLKCQKNCPKAFWPIKLSHTCKTEPLMKYINLEHWAAICAIVLFA